MFDVIELFHPRFAEDAKLEDGVPVPVDAQTDTATRYDGSDVGFSRLVDRVEDVIAEVLVEASSEREVGRLIETLQQQNNPMSAIL